METIKEKIFNIKLNKDNPRLIRDEKYEKLVSSILVFPKMLDIRPIVVDEDNVVLGGNMRLRALRDISKMKPEDIAARVTKIKGFGTKDERERASILSFWDAWLKDKTVKVVKSDDLTEDEKREFIIKDNASFGEWDWDILANDWDNGELVDWGIDIWEKVDFDDSDMFLDKTATKQDKEIISVELTGEALSRVQEITDVISRAVASYDGVHIS